jgi:hypothetical protein
LRGHIIFDAQIVMNAILALIAVGALVGLVLGRYFSWIAILVSVPILAIFSAMVLQNEGFDVLTGIAIIVVCLTVNQVAYWTGLMWLLAARQTDKALMTSPTMNQARLATTTLAAKTNSKSRPHLGEFPCRNSGGSPFCSLSHSTLNIAVSCSEGEAPDLAGGWGAWGAIRGLGLSRAISPYRSL